MNTVKNNTVWLPSLLEGLLSENRLDVPNYENFSTPPVNIKEKSTNFVIEIAIPGYNKSDFQIEVEENTLKASSELTEETATEDKNTDEIKYTRKEWAVRSGKRDFKLPKTINVDDIQANYEAGILSISLPKREEQKALKKMVEIS